MYEDPSLRPRDCAGGVPADVRGTGGKAMKIISPDFGKCLLPEGTRAVNIAEHQKPDYLTLPSLVTPDGRVLCQWMPEPNDLILLNNGCPITLVLHTFNQSLQPIQMVVGGADLR